MVVGGVPEVIPDHAQRIANQGMDMVLKAGEVKSPATGKALQVSEPKTLIGLPQEKKVGSTNSLSDRIATNDGFLIS